MENMRAKQKVRALLKSGVYDYSDIFRIVYPTYNGHYNTLRMIISEEKHRGVN